jgi:hypothetical protein
LVLRILQLKARALHLRESRKLFLASASLYRPSAFHGLQPHTHCPTTALPPSSISALLLYRIAAESGDAAAFATVSKGAA